MNGNTYDVVIIGGGVIGSSIARALSKYECRTVLLEKEEDVKNMEKLIDLLEENEDVQNVYHNWDE